MNFQPEFLDRIAGTNPRILRITCLAFVCTILSMPSSTYAVPGNNGTGYNTPPPAIPFRTTPVLVVPGENYTIPVDGISENGAAYYNRGSSDLIDAVFSDTGITVNSITIVNPTSLSINISVSLTAPLGGRTLTVINPDRQTATSTVEIIHVTDIPAITDASITPSQPSTLSTLSPQITQLQNLDGTVAYTYRWLENGTDTGYTSASLPPEVTNSGSLYRCVITPFKGSITGPSYTTADVAIAQDKDANGMQDDWEIAFYGNILNNPNGDDDGDGISNRTEYLFGLNPNDARSNCAITSPPRPAGTAAPTKFTYTRAANKLNGLNYKVWVSSDLKSWTEVSSHTDTTTKIDSQSESVEVSMSLNSGNGIGANRLFVRVSAE